MKRYPGTEEGQMERILLDCDGVIFDFVDAVRFYSASKSQVEIPIPTREAGTGLFDGMRSALHSMVECEPHFARLVHPYQGADHFIRRLKQLGHVIAVTAPFGSPHWCEDRTAANELLGIKDTIFCSAENKKLIEGDWMIEDTLANLIPWLYSEDDRRGIWLDRGYGELDKHKSELAELRSRNRIHRIQWHLTGTYIANPAEVYAMIVGIIAGNTPYLQTFDLGAM
jgi:hypothetical protein